MNVRSKKKVTSARVKGIGEALAGGRNRCLSDAHSDQEATEVTGERGREGNREAKSNG